VGNGLNQRGPTAFDLRAILQKHDYLRAACSKMMHKTLDPHDFKLKKGKISECVIEMITQ